MKDLEWRIIGEKPVCETCVFTVWAQSELPPEGSGAQQSGDYYSIACRDWAVVLPVLGDDFIMVRQWRHSLRAVTVEFPGGICDAGEDPMESARRELLEETGCAAGRLTHLGTVNPNPALFRNRVHFFLAEDLTPSGKLQLDADEVLDYTKVPISEAMETFGTGESMHAFTGTALFLYMREMNKRK